MKIQLDFIPPRHYVDKKLGYLGTAPGFWFCWYCCKSMGVDKKWKYQRHECPEYIQLYEAQKELGWITE